MNNYIGFCGPEGAGKSTASKIFREHHNAEIVPFAAPLKKMIEALGVEWEHLYGTPEQKAAPLELFNGETARRAMQTLGTEWGRQFFGPDFWVRAWAQNVQDRALPSGSLVVADDVRFASEVNAIRGRGGIIICIVRSPADFQRKPKHASEDFAALDYDAVAYNVGSIADLTEQLAVAAAWARKRTQYDMRMTPATYTNPTPVAAE